MAQNFDASIIVLNRNGEEIIERCLDSIMKQTSTNLEVIVVDNGSTDKSLEIIKSFPLVRLISSKRNLGFTGGCWAGIRCCSSDFVALINNDSILGIDWMEVTLRTIKSDSMIGAVAGKIFKSNGRIDSMGSSIRYPSGRSLFNRGYETGNVEDVASLPGSAFLINRTIALNVGFLDPDYFVLYDETDFFWRLRLAGYRCVYNPKAISWHIHAYTFARDSFWTYHRRAFLSMRNMIWMNLKNLGIRHLVPYVLFEISFGLKQFLKLVLRRDGRTRDYVRAYYVAVAATLLSARKVLRKRRFAQSIRRADDEYILAKHERDRGRFSTMLLKLS